MKRYFIGVCIVLTLLCSNGCSEKTEAVSANSDCAFIGMSVSEIRQILGEPTGILSGFWGDTFTINNGSRVIIYYDNDGNVETIKIINIDDEVTLEIN